MEIVCRGNLPFLKGSHVPWGSLESPFAYLTSTPRFGTWVFALKIHHYFCWTCWREDPGASTAWKRAGCRPGTLNNHFLMDVWWNSHFLCNDLESSSWNNHKKTGCLEFQGKNITISVWSYSVTPVNWHSWLENGTFEDVFPIQDGHIPAQLC